MKRQIASDPNSVSFLVFQTTGAYDLVYTGGPKGAFHKESGDSSGSKMGTYGLSGADGSVRIVDYTADGLGFRAHVQSNERGVDASKSPADVTFTNVGGIISGENHQHLTPPVQAPWSSPVLPGPSVTSGVPQISVLGPLLFLIFINYISDSIHSCMHLYAGDCVLYRDVHYISDCSSLKADLGRVE